MTSSSSRTGKRSTTLKGWWIASVLLIVVGVLLIIFVPKSAPQGPSISSPIGNTSLTPSQLNISTGSGPTNTSTTTVAPSSVTSNVPRGNSVATAPIGAQLSSLMISPAPPAPLRGFSTIATRSIGIAQSNLAKTRAAVRSRPVHLSIPTLGVSVSVGVLGLNRDRTVQVPTNFAQPGWYKFGPSPGQLGSAVILGHVDNIHGPAVFYRIAQLRPGNLVTVTEANHKKLTFSVIGVRMYLKSKFPAYLVYGPHRYAALQLVSCGGVFDRKTGHYLSNIVVFTALVK